MEPAEGKEVFYPEEAGRIDDAFGRVFGVDDRLLFVGVRYERERENPSEEEAVIFASSRVRFEEGYLMLVKRAPFERVLEVLEAGGLEIAGEKLRQEMLDRLSLAGHYVGR